MPRPNLPRATMPKDLWLGYVGWLIVALLYAAALTACSSSPTAPSPPPAPVIPNLAGQWNGTFSVGSCVESGAAIGSGFCQVLGSGSSHVFTPTQTGGNLGGTLAFGGFSIPVTGTVGTDNVVALAGAGPVQFGATLTLTAWRGTVSANNLTGSMTYNLTTGSPIGAALISANFALQR